MNDHGGSGFPPRPAERDLRSFPHVRYEAGDEISQFYDNLVGKLIVWGRDRDVAINRALRALGELKVEGIATTIPADIAILEHDDFKANEHSTKWVEEVLDLSGVSATATAPADDDEPKIKREVDVEVNGKIVVSGLQLSTTGDGTAKAVIHQVPNVDVTRSLSIRLLPKATEEAKARPVLNALEVRSRQAVAER